MKKMLLKFLPLVVALIGLQTASQAQATFTADLEFFAKDGITEFEIGVNDSALFYFGVTNHGPDDIDTSDYIWYGMDGFPTYFFPIQDSVGNKVALAVGDTFYRRGIKFINPDSTASDNDGTYSYCFFSKVNWHPNEFVFDSNEANDSTCIQVTFKGKSPTSAKDVKLASKISIYPNPAMDVVNIPVAAMHRGQDITLTVAAIDGRIVHTQSVKQNDRPIELSLSKWTKGLYIVTLQSAAGKETGRFVVQ